MADLPSPETPQFPRLGSYQVIRPLGAGGMSNVFQAVHQDTGSLVALKVLPRKLAQNPVLLQRFLKEAKSAEALDHPSIVAIYDRGNDGGRHYLVLEFVDGRDLFDHVRSFGPFDTESAVRLTREVAEGLRYAAGLGMVHRDIKPANLLLTSQGAAKIIDLGLALQTIEEDERVTRQGTTVGTVDYMSPEQARDSRRINESSDIYSLGCTLFYLLTGTPPYAGGTLADKLARHHSGEIPNVRDRNPSIAPDLAALIQQMMAKQPGDRPGGYDDLIGQLERIARGEPRLPEPAPLDVLIDDEDDSGDAIELTFASPIDPASSSGSGATRRPPAQAGPPEFSLAELAALDAESTGDRPRRPRPEREAIAPAVQAALLEPDDIELESSAVPRAGAELPLQTWIVAGLFVGLAIALVGVGLGFLMNSLRTDEGADPKRPDLVVGTQSEPDPTAETSVEARPVAPDRAPRPSAIRRPPEPKPAPAPPRPAGASPTIPTAITPQDLARFGFAADVDPIPTDETSPIVLRRFREPGEQGADSLASALVRATPLIEIADAGPVREDHFEMAGKVKIIRGRGGYHPILRIDAGSGLTNRDEEAKLVLGGGVERLVLQEIDLVVDLRDLPPNQTTLIQCRGADLTLDRCSITLHNAADRPGFSLIRTANGLRPNRIRLDRCLVRGPISSLVEVESDQCDLDIRRSVVIGAGAPLLRFGATSRPGRTLRTLGSVFCTSGSLLEMPPRPDRLAWRSLGCAYIHIDAVNPGAWLATRGLGAKADPTWLDLDGGANRWIGWKAPPSMQAQDPIGGGAPASSAGEARALLADRREDRPWPLAFLGERITAADFQGGLADGGIELSSVAVPSPSLYEETVDRFPPLLDQNGAGNGPRVLPVDPRPLVNLNFDARPGQEDLGAFLARQLTDPGKRYEVRVTGVGPHPMTPVRLPAGVTATIIGPAPNGLLAGTLQLTPNRTGDALFALGRGDLALENLAIVLDETKPEVSAIKADGGTTTVRQCSFRTRGEESANQANLIRIRGIGSISDRPILAMENCWIGTNRTAIALDLLRGTCQLKNCAVIAGRSAIQVRTADGPKAPGDLAADLSLENCTILAERFAVEATELGSPITQPSRPFLIWSRACVFPRSWRDQGALLALDRERFARGNLFWDSANDLYDVSRLLADGRAEGGPIPLADLRRHWVEVWGGDHARGDRGPDPRRAERILNFRDNQRGRATKPTLLQLELEPKNHRGQGVNFAQLPPIPKS